MEYWQPPESPAIPEGTTLASIAARGVAWVLDQILVGIPFGVLWLIVVSSKIDLFAQPGPSAEELVEAIPAWLVVLPVVTRVVYEAVMIGWLGQTVGMMAMRIKVHAADGGRLGWSHAGIRALVPGLANAVPGVGVLLLMAVYLSASFDKLRRGLHDRAAGSLVLVRPRPAAVAPPPGWYPPPGEWPPPPGRGPPSGYPPQGPPPQGPPYGYPSPGTPPPDGPPPGVPPAESPPTGQWP